MADSNSAARFEKFAIMRLSGKNDMIYRNYDLLTKERNPGNIRTHLYAAGQVIPNRNVDEPLKLLQHKFMKWGFGVIPLGNIEIMLHEFWVYQRIKHYGKKNWPLRSDEEIRYLSAINDSLSDCS